jgi:hypothetical protein
VRRKNLGNFDVGQRVSLLFVREVRRVFAGLKDDLVDSCSINPIHAGFGIGKVKSAVCVGRCDETIVKERKRDGENGLGAGQNGVNLYK